MAPGFIAIGSGPAGLSAAETFRSKHPHISVRILTTDPALPYAKPPLSKAYLCGREAKLDLHSPGWFVRNDVELIRGITVDHIDLARQEVVPRARAATPTAAGHEAAWNKVPEFSCTIGESTLRYRGWGAGYEHSRLVDHHHGFTAYYESSDELVGVLTLNADDDYRRADQPVRSHTPMTV